LHVSFEVNLSSALAASRNWLSALQFNNTRTFFCRQSADSKISIYFEAAQHGFRTCVPIVANAAQAFGTALKTEFMIAYYPNHRTRPCWSRVAPATSLHHAQTGCVRMAPTSVLCRPTALSSQRTKFGGTTASSWHPDVARIKPETLSYNFS
jgi:hypothetical protein